MRPDIAAINKQKAAERAKADAEVKKHLAGPTKELRQHINKLSTKAQRDRAERLISALEKFISAK